jgi:hypothetical protein
MITHNNNIQQKFCRSGKIYRLRAIDKTLTPDKDSVPLIQNIYSQ